MTRSVALACKREIITVPVTRILLLKQLSAPVRNTRKYQCIAASMRELGIIEPLIVFPQPDHKDFYILLDGHVRLQVARELGQRTVDCLIATDDEAFTYNHKVNRLSAIQEHFMIRRAIRNGVSEARIAKSLNVDVASIQKKRDLLEGICSEAVELLKEKRVPAGAIREMRKVKPIRQIEMAELMIASWNFSLGYAKCLLAATPPDQLIEQEQRKESGGFSPEDIARIEHEMEGLEQDFQTIEESHGRNVLNLVIVVGYLKSLLDSASVVEFLSQNHPEILTEFQKLVETRSLREEPAETADDS